MSIMKGLPPDSSDDTVMALSDDTTLGKRGTAQQHEDKQLTPTSSDADHEMDSDTSDDECELPQAPSALSMLLDASPAPRRGHKRSASCPAKIDDVEMGDLTLSLNLLDMAEPKTDPVSYDHDESGITPENAQTLLDPDACLFVANLPIHVSDRELEVALTHFMAKDGKVFVKVKRTHQGLPFAHVQYFNAATARDMLVTKNRQLLWNRQLRIEPATATRFLYVGYRDSGHGLPSDSEMHVLFQGLQIESVRAPTDDEQKDTASDKCVIVHFVKWGECGEALRTHRNHALYWMRAPNKSHLAPSNMTFVPVMVHPTQSQMPLIPNPYLNIGGNILHLTSSFRPYYQQRSFSPPSPKRPEKRRKRNPCRLDHIQEPNFTVQW